jgi:hypothetical protein
MVQEPKERISRLWVPGKRSEIWMYSPLVGGEMVSVKIFGVGALKSDKPILIWAV